jgi:hypothetical protein
VSTLLQLPKYIFFLKVLLQKCHVYFCSCSFVPHAHAHLILPYLIILLCCEDYKQRSSSLCSPSHPHTVLFTSAPYFLQYLVLGHPYSIHYSLKAIHPVCVYSQNQQVTHQYSVRCNQYQEPHVSAMLIAIFGLYRRKQLQM